MNKLDSFFGFRSMWRWLVVMSIFLPSLTVFGQFSRSNESMATSMYTIMLNTTWENSSTFQTFQIGVLDADTTFYSLIQDKYEGISFKGKKVSVKHFKTIDAISETQVLVIDKKFNKKTDKIGKLVAGNATLLITNGSKDSKFVMVNFNGRLKKDDFSINEKNMAAAGLRVNKQFEEYIAGNVSWEAILQASNEKLEAAQVQVAEKELQIKQQKKKINYQKMTLQEKVKLLDEQTEVLQEQQEEIDQQSLLIIDREHTLIDQQKRINAQKNQISKQLEALGMQRIILIMAFVVLILIIGFVYVLFKNGKQRKKSMESLAEQHVIVTSQKEQIEHILFELKDSIRYALRIQNAVLPSDQTLQKNIPGEHFIVFKPKDIVSGDFYFVDRRGEWTIVAVADCTGHGVPGAFMSMLCWSLLNEIAKQQVVLRSDVILNELREKVIDALHQKGIQGEQMDGMDISLLLINNNSMECQWSGANNPIYILRSDTKALEELRPDKRPIAIYPDMRDFTQHEFTAKKGDLFYLFTDGYSDQFGGARGKKFMSRNFKALIAENAHKSMSEQAKILEDTIEQWKKGVGFEAEQVDDITVLGIRLH